MLVGGQGVEPRMPEAVDLQSTVVTSATRHPNLAVSIVFLMPSYLHFVLHDSFVDSFQSSCVHSQLGFR